MERIDSIYYIDDEVKNIFTNKTRLTTLYRYPDPSKLKNKKLWFSNSSIWQDPYERLFLKSTYLFKGNIEKEHHFLNRVCIVFV